jgi:hypothetical protein
MSDQENLPEAPDESNFTYDVVVSLPEWAERSIIEQQARQNLGVPEEMLAHLMKSIQDHRMVKVKTDVPREKADSTAKKFESVGFRAEVTHTLKLKKLTQKAKDNSTVCPACESKVIPLAETQCPNCGVYINKLTEEFLMRKRLMKKERDLVEFALRDQKKIEESTRRLEMEQKIRAQVKAELEHKYGKPGKGRRNILASMPPYSVPALAILALVGAFFAGRMISFDNTGKREVLNTKAGSSKDDVVQKVLKQTNQLQVDLSNITGKEAEAAKQGVAVDPKDSLLASPGSPDAPPMDTSSLTPIITPEAKLDVQTELALMLAEIGQVDRARELIDKIVTLAKVSTNLKVALQLRAVQLKVDAWAIVHNLKPGQESIANISKQVATLADDGERCVTSAQIAAILLHRPDLDLDAVTPLFNLAEEAYQAQKGNKNDPRIGHELLTGRGRAILNHAQTRLAHGYRQKAILLTGQLDTLTRIAPDSSAAVLYGYSQRLSRIMGNMDAAQKNLTLALGKARKSASLVQEGQILRSLADAHNTYPEMKAALLSLNADAEKRPPPELAAVLLELGLIHARNGNAAELLAVQNRMTELVRPDAGLSGFEERLRGISEIALAWRAKTQNDLAGMENHIRLAAAMVN